MKEIHWSKHVTKVKDWIVKSLNHLIHYKALKQGFRNPMSPRVLRKKDPGYESVRELDFAICNKDCNNVTIRGVNAYLFLSIASPYSVLAYAEHSLCNISRQYNHDSCFIR